MKNWKDWALGVFMTLSGAFGMIAYNNLQNTLDTILLNQDKVYLQIAENTKDIAANTKDIFQLQKELNYNKEYMNTKFDLYDLNITQFYRNYGYLFKKPVSKVKTQPEHYMWINKKYYNELESMFDNHG